MVLRLKVRPSPQPMQPRGIRRPCTRAQGRLRYTRGPDQVPDVLPGQGRVPDMPGQRQAMEHRTPMWPGAISARAILADTPITDASPGKSDAGTTKSTADATVIGGMSEAPGTSIRSRWMVRRPTC